MATRHINLHGQSPIEVEETSTVESIKKKVSEWAGIEPFFNAFMTEGALSDFTFDLDGIEINHYENYLFTGMNIEPDGTGYLLTASTRQKTEIELLKEEQERQNEAIDYLIMG